jgi:hypothetical protein
LGWLKQIVAKKPDRRIPALLQIPYDAPSAPGDCLVKRLLLTIGTCVLLAAAAADARDWQTSMLAQAQGQSKKGPAPGRLQRGDHAKQQQGGQDRRGDQGRLTQEERQGLHRDLDRANREIYRR